MPDLQDVQHMLEMAERAVIDGAFSSAGELLQDAARIQEAALGPLHPDLANTLNNLAIVAEKTGRLDNAEAFYRRAAAIASASLPADHPMVVESRQNLEDFCRERGLPIGATAITTPSPHDTALVPEAASGAPRTSIGERARDADVGAEVGPSAGSAVPRTSAPTASQPQPPAPSRSLRWLAWLAIGAIALMTVALLLRRPWSSRETPTAASVTVPAAEPGRPPQTRPAPIEQAQPPKVVAPADDRTIVTNKPSSSASSSGAFSLTAAQLCQTFSTSGGRWRCDPTIDPVTRGPIVLYTRVRSSRDTAVVHRWYREDKLQRAVKLTIRANASEGYRTYSRQTVDGVGNWRVEVRSASGDLLYEQRFTVR
jgi:hypothetical protein